MLSLTCLGGAGGVTGSKHLLRAGRTRLLIDCGLFQGMKNLRELNWKPLPIAARDIDAVVLTHAHLDHCGYLPRLVREGYKHRVYASAASREVARLILLDSAWLQQKDAEFANRHGFSRHAPALPLYEVKDAEHALSRFVTVPLHQSFPLPGGAQLQLRRAGHILGASTAQIDIDGCRIVFSGDLGRFNDPLMHDPEPVPEADYIVIESTYGDRRHSQENPVDALGKVIERTVKRGGTVVIPTFAVGRAQTLIHHLWQLRKQGRLANVPVFLDSPMATSASELLHAFSSEHKLDPYEYDAACRHVTFVQDTADSIALSANRYPKVILSASGMATGGRVLHHIAAFASDPKNTLLFSGFQAAGTRGRKLLEGTRDTRIHGRWVPVNAELAELPMLSAHADSDELMRWLAGFHKKPKRVFIVHGEPSASEALRERIIRELGWSACAPLQGDEIPL